MNNLKFGRFDERELNFIGQNYKNMTWSKIGTSLNRPTGSIYTKARELKMFKRHNAIHNHNFFKNWNQEMSYILGFICADGCVFNKNGNYNLSISSIDKEHLEKIQKIMNDGKIRAVKNENGSWNIFYIHNKEIVNDLIKLGIVPRKSLILKFPSISDQFLSDFIRGYFDGDGHIGHVSKNSQQMICNFLGTFEFVTDLKKILSKHQINGSIYRHGSVFELKIMNSDSLLNLFNFMYNGGIFLERKHTIFKEIENYYKKTHFFMCIDCKKEFQKHPKATKQKRCHVCAKKYWPIYIRRERI